MEHTLPIKMKISGKANNGEAYPKREVLFEKDVTLMSESQFEEFLVSMYRTFLLTQTHYDLGYVIYSESGHTFDLTKHQENLLYHGGKK